MTILIGGLDFETTGFLEPEHRIIEACVRTFEVDPGDWSFKLVDSYLERYNPERSIPDKASQVHRIYDADVLTCDTLKIAAPRLFKALDQNDIVVAHNGDDFDFPYLVQEFDRVEQELPDFETFDTMQEGRWATAWGEVPNMQKLCFTCGVDYDPEAAHAADYDVDKMMESFFYGLKHGYFGVDLEALKR